MGDNSDEAGYSKLLIIIIIAKAEPPAPPPPPIKPKIDIGPLLHNPSNVYTSNISFSQRFECIQIMIISSVCMNLVTI